VLEAGGGAVSPVIGMGRKDPDSVSLRFPLFISSGSIETSSHPSSQVYCLHKPSHLPLCVLTPRTRSESYAPNSRSFLLFTATIPACSSFYLSQHQCSSYFKPALCEKGSDPRTNSGFQSLQSIFISIARSCMTGESFWRNFCRFQGTVLYD